MTDAQEFAITKCEPGSAIEANFDAVEKRVREIVALYSGTIVDLDYLPDAKKDRAWLNSMMRSVDQRRIEVKKRVMAPYAAFEDRVKKLLAPVKDVSADLDRQIKALEEQEKAAKRAKLVKHYEEYAPILVAAVPFERIEDPAWGNKTFHLEDAFKAIEATVDKLATDLETLEGLNLSHALEAKAELYATLDLSRAIARSKTLDEQEAAARKLDEQRAAVAPPRPAPAPAPVVGVDLASGPDMTAVVETPADFPELYRLEVTCSRAQFDDLLAYLRSRGIQGKAVRS